MLLLVVSQGVMSSMLPESTETSVMQRERMRGLRSQDAKQAALDLSPAPGSSEDAEGSVARRMLF